MRAGAQDVVKDVEVIIGELASFGAHLEDKPMIMVASKIDVVNKDKLATLKKYCKKNKLKLYEISAVTGKGIKELTHAMADALTALRAEASRKSTPRFPPNNRLGKERYPLIRISLLKDKALSFNKRFPY